MGYKLSHLIAQSNKEKIMSTLTVLLLAVASLLVGQLLYRLSQTPIGEWDTFSRCSGGRMYCRLGGLRVPGSNNNLARFGNRSDSKFRAICPNLHCRSDAH